MIQTDMLAESQTFWAGHQDVLDKFRARARTGEPCDWCDGRQRWVRFKGVRYNCPCYIVELEAEAAKNYRHLSHATFQDRSLTFETIKKRSGAQWLAMQAAIDDLKLIVKTPHGSKWVCVGGAPGIGKTHIAMAVYNKLSDIAIYALASKLATQFHDGLKKEGENSAGWVELSEHKRVLIDVPVLILDDLGSEYDGPFVNNMLTDIIAQRYQLGRSHPTIVTTNLLPRDLRIRYPRVESRLRDQSLVASHFIGLNDYREEKEKNAKG